MESLKNLLSLPVVKAAVDKVTDAYGKLKGSSPLVKEGVDKVESVVNEVKVGVSPITKELEGPFKVVDKFVCKGLVFIERKFPVLKEQPEVMYGALKSFLQDTVTPTVKTALSAVSECQRKLSPIAGFVLNQANKMATVVDVLARSSEKVIDYFFAKKVDKSLPNGYAEENASGSGSSAATPDDNSVVEEEEEDQPLPKVVETAETLGRVGLKLVRAGFIVSTAPLRWTLSWLVCKREETSKSSEEAASTVTSGTSSLSSGSLDKAA